MLLEKKINPMTAKRLIQEADRNSTGTSDLKEVLVSLPESTISAIDLFLSEFDYYSNKTSNRAIALRLLASGVSAVLRALENAEKAVENAKKKDVLKERRGDMTKILTENEAHSIAKKVIEERKLNPDILGKFEDLSVSDYISCFVIESLKKLAPIRAMLKDEDLLELKGYELDATNSVINEVYSLLDAVVDLYARTH